MNRKGMISLGLTFLCAILILGIGYMGIVKGGNLLLSNEEEPQRVEYENSSSNIFYGKIDDDIQIFPWKYYGQNEVDYDLEQSASISDFYFENLEGVLHYMEGYCCDVAVEVIEEVYVQKGTDILESLSCSDAGEYGRFFFYQDILEIEGKKYQVKIALNQWSVYSFICMEYREGDVRELPEWENGKQVLAEMLDEYEAQVGESVYSMLPYYTYYMDEGIVYLDTYIKSMEYLNYILHVESEEEVEKMKNYLAEEAEAAGQIRKEYSVMKGASDYNESPSYSEGNWDYEETYSYQVIELNDMILLLIQGEYDIGLYYDPVSQRFCGYNYF